ncbi:GlsB/YeaQ/YmgE family stress response membrane protein [Gordonia liuliyuniae]|uniref:GlsB/YeaQ/YmgE family stress response membrane protein n=1 Tax=Gordonia liuliyuniae TaxID=2911517 RepID=A0ABS9IUR9_9ACTN|nr:GlsB/YeaQ/YmgE family stress response membrane protein [Gordonia liuliyuniae]MCF8589227.1 GlsB/YeaQ/YmgE family stress response membrane protein [Gordonia liuliyuniae]
MSEYQLAATEILARSSTFTSVGWIGYIIIGGLAGWLASKLTGADARMGILANIAVGIVGALLGGYILSFFLDTASGGMWFTFATALFGSLVLLGIIGAIARRR